ncbi:hypothetical protein BD770DRAFT_472488, partial [Pilaira anomala]
MDKENNALVVKGGLDNVNSGIISSDADITSNKTSQNVSSLLSTLSAMGEQISDTMTMDNELEALIERVRRAQIFRAFGSISEKLPLDYKSTDTPAFSKKTIDLLLKETGAQAEINDIKAAADQKITKYKTLHGIALSDNAILTKEKEYMQVKIADLKDEILTLKAANHALKQKSTSDYQKIEKELASQKEAAKTCVSKLYDTVFSYYSYDTSFMNLINQNYNECKTLFPNQ